MKNLTSTLALAALLGLNASHAMATNPTPTVVGGQVVNSTYTFTNITHSGTMPILK